MARLRPAALVAALLLPGCGGQDRFDVARRDVCEGRYAEAVDTLKNYRGPEGSRAGLFLGKAYLALGDVAEARAAWEQTRQDFPTSVEAHKCRYKLAMLDMLSGDDEAAAAAFRAMGDAPDGPLAAEATAMADFLDAPPEAAPDGGL